MALVPADGKRVEQGLGRVLARAVAAVDHRAVDLLRQQLHCARFGWRTTSSRAAWVESSRRVNQGLALAAPRSVGRPCSSRRHRAACRPVRRRCGCGRGLEEQIDRGCGRSTVVVSCRVAICRRTPRRDRAAVAISPAKSPSMARKCRWEVGGGSMTARLIKGDCISLLDAGQAYGALRVATAAGPCLVSIRALGGFLCSMLRVRDEAPQSCHAVRLGGTTAADG